MFLGQTQKSAPAFYLFSALSMLKIGDEGGAPCYLLLTACYFLLHPIHLDNFLLPLAEYVVFFADFDECGECFFEMMHFVSG